MTAYILAFVSFQGVVTIGHYSSLSECQVQRTAQAEGNEHLVCLVYLPARD
jgi:hypothetical protein